MLRTVVLSLLFILALPAWATRAEEATPAREIHVLLWFDTEDYLLPADDDATLRLCEMLTKRGIRATFKMVGEKARVLQRRKRTDVIEALKKHDIGYHSDFHSVHPAPAEYLAHCGLLDGIAEFTRRESNGAADVRRIFGVPTLSCYGQPGASWGSQAVVALKDIGCAPHGVPCYVDEGQHMGLNSKPFWYCGALNVFKMKPNSTRIRDLHDPTHLQPAKDQISETAERLRADGGGLISIYYHPCEWVHREFWDGVNFSRGANPPAGMWKAPPQRTEAETDAAFERFAQYIDHIRTIPSARFVVASDLPLIYADQARKTGASADELASFADRILSDQYKGVDFVRGADKAFSAADQFEMLVNALIQFKQTGAFPPQLLPTGLLGPDSAPPEHSTLTRLGWPEFSESLRDTHNYIQVNKRIPPRIFIGADAIPPADYMVALASAYVQLRKTGAQPAGVDLRALELLSAKNVAEDSPKVFGWLIHKEGFQAPRILEIARLQTWTLKPAIRAKQ